MGYAGNIFPIPCDIGGFSHNPNIDTIEPTAMVEPSSNINIHNGYRQPRGGTSKVNGTAVSGTPEITEIKDYILPGGTQYVTFSTNDGKIYKNFTTAIKTGLTVNKVSNFSVFQDLLYHTNKADVVQTWNGSAGATSNLANPHADFAANQPIQLIVHGKGLSGRLWAVCGTRAVYASAVDSDNFATGIKIPIDTKDDTGIIGAIEWKDSIWLFGKRQTFLIDDADATTDNWSHENAPWNAGAGNHRLIVKTDNDLVVFTIDGDIYSVTSAIQTGDYQASSIAHPAFIDRWIRDNIDLGHIDKFHACYDPVSRRVEFFMVRNGSSQVNVSLIYNIDRPAKDAWCPPHENTGANSGYKASCSALVRKAVGNSKIYTGDYAGVMWELETANLNDNSAAYRKEVSFPYTGLSNPLMTKIVDNGRIVTEPQGNYNLTADIWIDNTQLTAQSVSLAGTGATLDNFILDTDVLGGAYLIDTSFPTGAVGKRIKGSFYNTGVNEDFRISQIIIQFRNLAVRP